jgi:PAS domain S-box-containing protein
MLPSIVAAIVAGSPDAVLVVDADGCCHDANPAACHILGYSRDELLQLRGADLVSSDANWMVEANATPHAGGNWCGEIVLRRKDGRLLPLAARSVLIPSPDGSRYAWFLRDVTERKAVEADPAEPHLGTQEVLERITDGFYALDREWRFIYVNQTAESIIGRTRGELLGQNHWQEFGPEITAQFFDSYQRAMAEGVTVEVDLHYAPANRWFEGRVYPSAEGVSVFFRDVTERKRTQQALQDAETKFRALVEQLPAIVSLNAHDEHSSTLYVSPQIEQILGYAPAEYTADPAFWLQTVHPDDLQRVLAEIARTNVTGEPFRVEYRRITRDGRVIWILDEGVLVRDDAGRPRHWQTVQLDITDRKRAEEELRQSEERFRTAFDHAAIGMSLVGLDGRFLRVNPALSDLTGYSEPELLTKTFQEITHPDDLEADLAQVDRLLAGEMRAFHMEKRYLRKDGEVIWIRLSCALVRDAQGAPLHLIGQLEDITERQRAEETVRASEARFRSLISNATDIITILDAGGVIQYESPPIERILGYHSEELLGRNAFELVHPDDRTATWQVFECALADPTVVPTVEFRFRHSDGSWRWLESTGTNLLADPNVGGFVVNSREITERKRANEVLRLALDAAQTANQAKGLFLDMMSHELRTPLQAVLGYSEFLLAGPQRALTAEQREDIGYIHQAGGRMIALINQVLDLSRMEAGRLELAAEPVNLVQVIEAVRQDVAPQAAAKSLALQIDLPPSLPLVIGDEERLRQILLNLVGNAVKFTEAGGIRVAAAPTPTGGLEVVVSDTGVGISADAVPHVFDEFRQGDSYMTRRYGGAGLGLAIARKLAEQMGGSIRVSSEPNVGSTFTLHLPLHPPEPTI